jgi:hypothetical protein
MHDPQLEAEATAMLASEGALHADNLWKLPPHDRDAFDREMARHARRVVEILDEYHKRGGAGGREP